jgi:superfamily I DNA/RNA helicase
MTRAKQRLVLVATRKRTLLGRRVENRACPFLDDVPPGLLLDRIAPARRRKPRQLSLI